MKKIILITGAAHGIGLALAKACLSDGMKVIMVDKDECALNTALNQLDQRSQAVTTYICDVTNPSQVTALAKNVYDEHHHVDILINNAGISGHLAPVWELNVEHIRHVLDVNLYGVLHCIQAFLPHMFCQTSRPHIVNMSSLYGLCSGSHMAAYSMSKHAIVTLSESLYFDLQRLQKPVDVSVVCPSFVNTQLIKHSAPVQATGIYEKIEQLMSYARPVDDLAAAILEAIHQKIFYIIPDKETKDCYEQRSKAVCHQTMPHVHHLEKIMSHLSRTEERRKTVQNKK